MPISLGTVRSGEDLNVEQARQDFLVTHCTACGSEIDSEGWCANYCTGDGQVDEIISTSEVV